MRYYFMAIIPVLLVLAILAGPAAAQQQAGKHGQFLEMMQKADVDHNGQLTFEELSAVAPRMTRERFAGLDRNGDGVLSRDDRPEQRNGAPAIRPGAGSAESDRAGHLREMFKRADSNQDGAVTFEELTAVAPRMDAQRFARLDRNGDKVLTPSDAVAGGPAGPRAQQGNHLARVDVNGDGRVTFDEISAVAPRMTPEKFKSLDTNGDGALTGDELQIDRMRQGRFKGQSGGGPESQGHLRKDVLGADSDGDGRVSYDELAAKKPGFPRELFDRLDRDGNGFVAPNE